MKRIASTVKQDLLQVIPPPSTGTYKTITHGAIIDTLYEQLDKEGLSVVEETYSSTGNRQVMQGHMIVNLGNDNDIRCEIAFLNSYNKSRRAVVASGSNVIVCYNGHILGDTMNGVFKRKHMGTADIEIGPRITEIVKTAADNFAILVKQKERMKEIEVDKKIRNELIGQLYLDDLLVTDTQLSIIRKEIIKPTFDYSADPNSLWYLYNHITCGMKTSHPYSWIYNHQKLNEIVDTKFQLV